MNSIGKGNSYARVHNQQSSPECVVWVCCAVHNGGEMAESKVDSAVLSMSISTTPFLFSLDLMIMTQVLIVLCSIHEA